MWSARGGCAISSGSARSSSRALRKPGASSPSAARSSRSWSAPSATTWVVATSSRRRRVMPERSRFGLDPRAARVTWTVLVFLAVLGLGYVVRYVLLLVALSLFFAYLLFPLVRLAQRWVIRRRPLAIGVVYLVALAVLGGAGLAVGPRLAAELQGLAQTLPEITKRIQNGEIVIGLLARGGWESQQIREID